MMPSFIPISSSIPKPKPKPKPKPIPRSIPNLLILYYFSYLLIIFEIILIIVIRIVTRNEIGIIQFIALFTNFILQDTNSRLMINLEVLTLIIPPIRLP